jgi:steroid 5-alpha reductase family enzyme
MRRFKKRGAPGDVMDRGLWAWSRHPNYVCEWLVWLAYPIIGLVLMRPDTVLTLLGPMIMYLVLRYGTGAPMLERSMIERRGEGFRDYQRRVPIFFPWPPGWTSRK